MVSIDEDGHFEATRRMLEAAAEIRRGIGEIPGLAVLGYPLWVIVFTSEVASIYDVLHRVSKRGWSLNGLQRPAAVHLCGHCVTPSTAWPTTSWRDGSSRGQALIMVDLEDFRSVNE